MIQLVALIYPFLLSWCIISLSCLNHLNKKVIYKRPSPHGYPHGVPLVRLNYAYICRIFSSKVSTNLIIIDLRFPSEQFYKKSKNSNNFNKPQLSYKSCK